MGIFVKSIEFKAEKVDQKTFDKDLKNIRQVKKV